MMDIRKTRYMPPFLFILALLISVLGPVGDCRAVGDVGVTVERADDPGKINPCFYCGRLINLGDVHRDAEIILANLIKEGLTERGVGYRQDAKNGSSIHVLVYKFEERKGGEFGAEKPAGVGFHMHLIDQGNVRRTFVFDENQEALTSNLFNIKKFFRRGARWITVEQLAREGVNDGLVHLLEEP